jgi:hypothetical protein
VTMTDLNVPTFTARSEIMFLEELFEEIRTGRLRSPRFQRSFVWRPDDMVKLLDSVVKGYPIGSLLVWKPGERYQCKQSFGPFYQGEPGDDRADLSYVLDGQHRLATLFGTTHSSQVPVAEASPELWTIYYDLVKQAFTHAPRTGVRAYHLPLREMMGTTDFLRYCQRLLESQATDPDDDAKDGGARSGAVLVKRAEQLLKLFRTYRVPVVRINGGELSQAMEIFSRLNSSGRGMSVDQMVSALTYREGEKGEPSFDLATKITEIVGELAALHFGGFDRNAVLRSVAGQANIKIHSRPAEQVTNFLQGQDFDAQRREEVVGRASRGLVAAARWLNDAGVVCDRVLPYALQLVLLSQVLDGSALDAARSQTLRRWLFATSFAGWFAGGNTTQVNEDLDEMARFGKGETTTFRAFAEAPKPFPVRFDLRAARVRALLLATLIPAGPLQRRHSLVDIVALLAGDDAAGVPKVFPRATGPDGSSPANRIFLPTHDGDGARAQLLALPAEERDEVLRSHCIDGLAWEALQANDSAAFFVARTRHLMDLESTLMDELGLQPSRDMVAADPLLDADP